jgi:hypothetical protein
MSYNELDDEADYGFRFGQLNLQDDPRFSQYSAAYNRPQFPIYPSHQAFSPPPQSPYMSQPHLPHLQSQTPFIPYQQWQSPPMSPMPSYDQHPHSSFADDGQARWQSYSNPPQWSNPSQQTYQGYIPQYQPQYEPPMPTKFRALAPWSGPPKQEAERERKAYHPQPPARRSDWVMWVGNV